MPTRPAAAIGQGIAGRGSGEKLVQGTRGGPGIGLEGSQIFRLQPVQLGFPRLGQRLERRPVDPAGGETARQGPEQRMPARVTALGGAGQRIPPPLVADHSGHRLAHHLRNPGELGIEENQRRQERPILCRRERQTEGSVRVEPPRFVDEIHDASRTLGRRIAAAHGSGQSWIAGNGLPPRPFLCCARGLCTG
jgi:hypothetical protein